MTTASQDIEHIVVVKFKDTVSVKVCGSFSLCVFSHLFPSVLALIGFLSLLFFLLSFFLSFFFFFLYL